jgi:hypothetical protein
MPVRISGPITGRLRAKLVNLHTQKEFFRDTAVSVPEFDFLSKRRTRPQPRRTGDHWYRRLIELVSLKSTTAVLFHICALMIGDDNGRTD